MKNFFRKSRRAFSSCKDRLEKELLMRMQKKFVKTYERGKKVRGVSFFG